MSQDTVSGDKLVEIAQRQLETGLKFKEPRIKDIQENEDAYQSKTKKTLKGRFNIPIPVMSGYVDTLLAKIDDVPKLVFKENKEESRRKAKKIGAAWEVDASSTRGQWAKKDRAAKKLAIFSGRAIYKYYAERSPDYTSHLDVVDYHDFICEPQGGGLSLENHLFLGQTNIFKTKYDLEQGAKSGFYVAGQVTKLLSGSGSTDKDVEQGVTDRFNRMVGLGLNPMQYDFVGDTVFSMVEWYLSYEGERYYLLFEPKSGLWVRMAKLKEMFSFGLYPFVSWATHEDPLNFWSKAPADDIRPLHESMRVLFNQTLDNRNRQNYGMRAFDAKMFPDPSQLEYRQDGLVLAKPDGRPIDAGLYTFQTPAIGDNIQLLSFVDNFVGTKTGITPAAQGSAEKDVKVGVYYGNIQQVADRMGLLNKSYSEAWSELGERYVQGLMDHMDPEMMVKMTGAKGMEWEAIKADEFKDDDEFEIMVMGGNAEAELDEVKKKQRVEAVAQLMANKDLMGQVSPRWIAEQVLRNGGFQEEDLRVAFDKDNAADADLMSEAAEACEEIVRGKEPKQNYRATTAFIQKILDFAMKTELKLDVFQKLLAYAKQHEPVAIENMARMANRLAAKAGTDLRQAPTMPEQPPMPEELPQGTPQGTQQRSADMSQMLTPNMPV